MDTDIDYEKLLFEHVKKVKNFNELLIKKYNLNDSPYRVAGTKFPRVGELTDDQGSIISYRFHGRGATIFDKNLEIDFDVDLSSKNKIIISLGAFYFFLKNYLERYQENVPLESIMENLEHQGIFIKRRIEDLATFHVNEKWYESKLKGLPFNGEGKDDTDWDW